MRTIALQRPRTPFALLSALVITLVACTPADTPAPTPAPTVAEARTPSPNVSRSADDFDVKRVRVHDPLYPHGSVVWGKSPKPNGLISLDTLAKQYVIRDRGRVNLGVPPGWLLVLPVKA